MTIARHYTPLDRLLNLANDALTTIAGKPFGTGRPSPAKDREAVNLDATQAKHAAGLMRVNHAGEVSAQALYQGQALTAREEAVREKMQRAAAEENDHLVWCEQRLTELDSRPSLFNPLWYAGSFAIGALAGAVGDKWSLGFIVETERQVIKHLDEHLAKLPADDDKSRAVLVQMKEDESHHATTAMQSGAAELPAPVKKIMTVTSKVMTKTAYWI